MDKSESQATASAPSPERRVSGQKLRDTLRTFDAAQLERFTASLKDFEDGDLWEDIQRGASAWVERIPQENKWRKIYQEMRTPDDQQGAGNENVREDMLELMGLEFIPQYIQQRYPAEYERLVIQLRAKSKRQVELTGALSVLERIETPTVRRKGRATVSKMFAVNEEGWKKQREVDAKLLEALENPEVRTDGTVMELLSRLRIPQGEVLSVLIAASIEAGQSAKKQKQPADDLFRKIMSIATECRSSEVRNPRR